MITARNIVKNYNLGDREHKVLKNLSFEVPKKQFLAITGMSGSGKSTLLYQLSLLDHPTEGIVTIDGVDASKLTSNERIAFRLQNLGYIFQDYAILPSLSAKENVMLPLLMQGMNESSVSKKAEEALSRVGLEERFDNLPSQLSGGQQQRVSIARAIVHDPKILFADEPTANLDTESSRTILDIFLDLHKQGQTIVMVTHEPEYALLTERNIELRDGTIIKDKMQKVHIDIKTTPKKVR